jgi:glycosyltransferase involved in cell wall biosynthesis
VSTDRPRVSIGLPVYNGEKYIAEAIRCVVNQTYTDLELIISDNASSDRTLEICQAFTASDSRIRLFANATNVGAAKNFNRLVQLSRGEYFKWTAHDDLFAGDFIRQCVKVLDANPGIVLCQSSVETLDEHGYPCETQEVKLRYLDSPNPVRRFGELIRTDYFCTQVFGLIRSSTLKRTSLIGSYIGSDRVLLVQLGLLGPFHRLDECLFFNRDHPQRSIRAIPYHLRSGWFDPKAPRRMPLPHWQLLHEYLRSLRRSPLDRFQKAQACFQMFPWFKANLNWARLASDLIIAIWPKSAGVLERLRDRYYDGPSEKMKAFH